MTANTIIIGAGWAGAVAARHLTAAGRSVIVLEARNRIGGRAFTLQGEPGQSRPIDLGCSWIHGYNKGNPVRDIAAQAVVNVTVAKPSPQVIVGPDGPLPVELQSELKSNLGAAISSARAQARDLMPDGRIALPSYLLNSASALFKDLPGAAQAYAIRFAKTLEIPLGAPLDTISMRWYGFEDNYYGSDGAPEGGFQSLVTKVFDSAKVSGALVRLEEVVTGIELTKAGLPSEITVTTNKGTYTAQTILCTIPLGVLQSGSAPIFSPSLPLRRQGVIARTKVGALNKLVLSYPAAWWAKDIGSFVLLPTKEPTAGEEHDNRIALQNLLNSTTVVVVSVSVEPTPMLMVLFGAEAAIAIERFWDESAHANNSLVREVGHDYLAGRLPSGNDSSIPSPTHAYLTRWCTDPFAKGATTTPVQIGDDLSPLDFAELAKPLWGGVLGFAGEHTSVHHRGSIAGAVESGVREAERIERLLRLWEDKQNIQVA